MFKNKGPLRELIAHNKKHALRVDWSSEGSLINISGRTISWTPKGTLSVDNFPAKQAA